MKFFKKKYKKRRMKIIFCRTLPAKVPNMHFKVQNLLPTGVIFAGVSKIGLWRVFGIFVESGIFRSLASGNAGASRELQMTRNMKNPRDTNASSIIIIISFLLP
jgi:hypothetical protein